MTKKEFIKKWNVAYESKEQQSEFNNEMLKDLNDIDERIKFVLFDYMSESKVNKVFKQLREYEKTN